MKRKVSTLIVSIIVLAMIVGLWTPDRYAFAAADSGEEKAYTNSVNNSDQFKTDDLVYEDDEDPVHPDDPDEPSGDDEVVVTDVEAPFIPTQTFKEFEVSYTDTPGDYVRAYGSAPNGEKVKFYCDSVYLGSLVADNKCVFQGNVKLSDKQSGSVYAIKAVCECEDATYQKVGYIRIDDDAPIVTGLIYYDSVNSDESIDLYEKMTEGEDVWVGYFGDDDPFRFVIEFSDPEAVGNAYIVAVKEGLRYELEATYDESLGGFVAEGYFEDGNKAFAPDAINVEFTPAAFPERSYEEIIDIGEGSQVFQMIQDQFPNVQTSKSIYDEDGATVTELICSYFDKKPEDGVQDVVKYAIKGLDFVTGMELYDSYSNVINNFSYVVDGLNDKKYLLNIDLSDPYECRVLLLDTLSGVTGTAKEIIITCFNVEDSTELPVKWMEFSDSLDGASSILSYISSYEKIENKTNETKQNLLKNSNLFSDEELEEAMKLLDELDSDQKVFKLFLVGLPCFCTGGMSEVVPGLKSLLSPIEKLSDAVFQRRADMIKASLVSVEWNKNIGSCQLITSDNISLDISYTIRRKDYYSFYTKTYHICTALSINARGTGIYDYHHTNDAFHAVWDILENAFPGHVCYNVGYNYDAEPGEKYDNLVQRLQLNEGITGIYGLGYNIMKLIIPDSAKDFSLADSFASAGPLYSAGPSENYDICFHWEEEIPDNSLSLFEHLETIVLPSTIKRIGEYSLHSKYTESINIPASVEYIGENAIGGESLTQVVFNSNFECDSPVIEGNDHLVTLGNTGINNIQLNCMDKIPNYAFKELCNLKTIKLVEPIGSIEASAFVGCTDLESLYIGPGDSFTIGDSAFYACSSLTNISVFADRLILLDRPFRNCTKVNKLILPIDIDNLYKMYDGYYDYKSNIYDFLSFIDNIKTAGPYNDGNEYDFEYRINSEEPSIPDYYFDSFSSLQSVVLPDNLKTIGIYAFSDTDALIHIEIPDSVTTIYRDAFYNSGIQSIELPSNLEYIAGYLFANCKNLKTVSLPNGITNIYYGAFMESGIETISIPSSVVEIYSQAFYGCDRLKTINMSDNVKGIDSRAFAYSGIESIKLSSSLEKIETGLFEGCKSLESIVIPDNIKSIGSDAFKESGIRAITIPSSVEAMGSEAFSECKNLKSVVFRDGLKTISNYCFALSGVETITLPNTLEEIESDAFFGCENLSSVIIPDSVKTIEGFAFAQSGVQTVTLPTFLDRIQSGTFSGCKNLTTIYLPANVNNVGGGAFKGCSRIKDIYFYGDEEQWESVYYSACESGDNYYFITATLHFVNSGSQNVPVTGIIIYESEISLGSSEPFTLNIFISPPNATNKSVIWTSDDETIATVDKSGTVRARGNGETTISVTTVDGGFIDSCLVIVDADEEDLHVHDLTKVEKKEATCMEDGNVEYWLCIECGKAFEDEDGEWSLDSDEITIPATGHDWSEWITVHEATETENGLEERSCRNDSSHKQTRIMPAKNHEHSLEFIEENDATCTEDGNIGHWICTECGNVFEDKDGEIEIDTEDIVIPKTGHEAGWEEEENVVEATCTSNGSYDVAYYCENCGVELSRKTVIIRAFGHDWDDWEVVKEPTDTEDGLEERVCFNDPSHKETRIIPAGSCVTHSLEYVEWKDATCTEDGNYDYWICTECGKLFEDEDGECEINMEDVEIPMYGHDIYEEIESIIEATCTKDGSYDKVCYCDYCGIEISREKITVDALGHDYEDVDGTAIEATCVETGRSADKKCSRCGEVIDGKTIDALGHDWDEWIITKEPTEEEEGWEYRLCKNDSSHKEERSIPKLGHIHEMVKTEAVEATCTTDGNIEYWTCADCGWIYSDEDATNEIDLADTIIKAKGHNEEVIPAVEPTCTEAGLSEGKKCSTCGETLVYQEIIPALGHELKVVIKPSTLKNNGSIVEICKICGTVQSTTTIYHPKTIKLSTPTYVYDGKAKKPAVTVKDTVGNKLVKDTDYTVTYTSGRKAIGKYKVKVTFKGNYSGVKELIFTIKPAKVTGLKLTSPKSKQLKVTYKKAKGDVKYQIVYRVKGASTWKKVSVTGTSKLIKKLKGGKTYQVKVRAFKKVNGTTYYGAYTSIKSLKVKK